jgi:hypothetical protein
VAEHLKSVLFWWWRAEAVEDLPKELEAEQAV